MEFLIQPREARVGSEEKPFSAVSAPSAREKILLIVLKESDLHRME